MRFVAVVRGICLVLILLGCPCYGDDLGKVPVGAIISINPNFDNFWSQLSGDGTTPPEAQKEKVLAKYLWERGFALCSGKSIAAYRAEYGLVGPSLFGTLPDLNNGLFLRGGSIAVSGTRQADAIQGHGHKISALANSTTSTSGGSSQAKTGSAGGHTPAMDASSGAHTHSVSLAGKHKHGIHVIDFRTDTPDNRVGEKDLTDDPHGVPRVDLQTTEAGDHTHSVTGGGHAHVISPVPDHQHDIPGVASHSHTIDGHTHTTEGISELSGSGSPRVSTETRPMNMAIVWIIRVR